MTTSTVCLSAFVYIITCTGKITKHVFVNISSSFNNALPNRSIFERSWKLHKTLNLLLIHIESVEVLFNNSAFHYSFKIGRNVHRNLTVIPKISAWMAKNTGYINYV